MGVFNDISNWFKDLFKESVGKEEEQKLINQLAGMDAQQRKRLDEIVNEYAESFRPEDKVFEYLPEYTPIDDETLKKQSEEKYNPLYQEDKEKTEQTYQNKFDKLDEQDENNKLSAENKSNYYTEKYKDVADKFRSTASKNGIADSSISTTKKEAIDSERDSYISDVMDALNSKLASSNNKRDELSEQKENKLNSLDTNYKKKIDDYFNDLIKEEQDKVKQVEKTNTATAKEEKAYKDNQEKVVKEKMKEMQEIQKEMLNNEKHGIYSDDEREKDYATRYELAKEFYSKYKKKSALQSVINNETLKDFLGSHYNRLIKELQNE